MGTVTVIGSMNLDITVRVPRFARAGETLVGSGLDEVPGGKSSNQAAAAALLAARVVLVGAVGTDRAGDRLIAEARERGIDTSRIARLGAAATGRAIIQVDELGENIITVIPGANDLLTAELLDDSAFDGSSIVSLALEVPLPTVLEAARRARRHGARVVLNPSPYSDLPSALLEAVDVLLMNEHEAAQFIGADAFAAATGSEALAERLNTFGIDAAVVTLGPGGSFALHRDPGRDSAFRSFGTPALRVIAVDTTGCGDAFTGSLCASLAAGVELPEAVERATAVAGFAARRRGAQSSYPTVRELEGWVHGSGAA